MKSVISYLKFSLACSAIWILCEVAGGLSFQWIFSRPWEYHLFPMIYKITSPVIWLIAFLLLPICYRLCSVVETRFERWGWGVWTTRAVYFATVMPVMEVLINEFIFKAAIGRPLYLYTYLPTFHGSGSYLSPIYYQTLLVHYAGPFARVPAPLSDRKEMWNHEGFFDSPHPSDPPIALLREPGRIQRSE